MLRQRADRHAGATVAMQAAGPLKRLLPSDRITLISATTGTVANPGSHILGMARTATCSMCRARRADRHVGRHQSDAGRQQALPQSIGAGIGALAGSGGMLSAADLRGPERRGLFFSPDLGHTRYTDKNLKLDRANAVFGYALGGATAAGDYVVAPLVEAGRTLAARLRPGGLSAEGQEPRRQRRRGHPGALLVPGRHVPASLRSGRMRGSYTDDIDGSTSYRSRSNYWGAHAMLGHVMPLSERGQLDAYARLQWQRLGGDSARNDAGDQLSYDATQALRTPGRAPSTRPATRRACGRGLGAGRQDRGARAARWQGAGRGHQWRRDGAGKRARAGSHRRPGRAPERARPVRGQAGNRGEAFVYRRF